MQPIIVAIDGFSSCGKSTLAKALAKQINYSYIDTGAMYRAVTLYFHQNQIDPQNLNDAEIDAHIDHINISFNYDPDSEQSLTLLNGTVVEELIRGKEVSEKVSFVSQIPAIRKRMVELQKKAGAQKKVVVDGRDIGTVVFPEAEVKVFMTADPKIRAQRRFQELVKKGQKITLEEVEENLKKRDYNDTHRKENPLRQADNAVVLDNTYLDQEEQLHWILKLIEEKLSQL